MKLNFNLKYILFLIFIVLIHYITTDDKVNLFTYSFESDSFKKLITLFSMYFVVLIPKILYDSNKYGNYYALILVKYIDTKKHDLILLKDGFLVSFKGILLITIIINIIAILLSGTLFINYEILIKFIIYFTTFLLITNLVFQDQISIIVNTISIIIFTIFSPSILVIVGLVVLAWPIIAYKYFKRGDIY